MKFISEEQSSALINHDLAFVAAREALIAATAGTAIVFPAVLAHGSAKANRFSIKSAKTADLAGLKVGSYWPENVCAGLPRHNSAILLFDQRIGRIEWVIEAGAVNAYRTAAADAVAVDMLARPEAAALAIFGTGHQALYECRAIARVRSLEQVLVVGRDGTKSGEFVARLRDFGLQARICEAQQACEEADIVVTATSARAPLFEAEWIGPGTHVTSMGSDAAGKQELPPALFERAALFCDLPSQASTIGELQHFTGDRERIVPIGAVLSGAVSGRTSADQVTVFDSSGIALQDLYVASHLISAFER